MLMAWEINLPREEGDVNDGTYDCRHVPLLCPVVRIGRVLREGSARVSGEGLTLGVQQRGGGRSAS